MVEVDATLRAARHPVDRERPTIVHMIASPVRGAPREIMYRLVAGIDRERWRPAVAFIRHGYDEAREFNLPSMLGEFEALDIPVFVAEMERTWDVRGAAGLSRFLRGVGTKLIVSHLNRANEWGWLLGWWGRAKTVPVVHGLEPWRRAAPPDPAFLLRAADRPVLRRADRVVCVSRASMPLIVEDQKTPAEKVVWIPGGIDLARYQAESLPLRGSRPPTIAMITRIHPDKGLDEFVDAIAGVQSRRPDIRAVVAGDGPGLASMRTRAAGRARIDFLGHLDDVGSLLSDIDIFALPSYHEGTPLSVVEAMSAGRAIVVSDVGGMPDMIRDGISGAVIPAHDAGALEKAFEDLLGDPDRARQMGAAARRDADIYSMPRVCAAWEEIYTEVLG